MKMNKQTESQQIAGAGAAAAAAAAECCRLDMSLDLFAVIGAALSADPSATWIIRERR